MSDADQVKAVDLSTPAIAVAVGSSTTDDTTPDAAVITTDSKSLTTITAPVRNINDWLTQFYTNGEINENAARFFQYAQDENGRQIIPSYSEYFNGLWIQKYLLL